LVGPQSSTHGAIGLTHGPRGSKGVGARGLMCVPMVGLVALERIRGEQRKKKARSNYEEDEEIRKTERIMILCPFYSFCLP
jgi:hypothetical protein